MTVTKYDLLKTFKTVLSKPAVFFLVFGFIFGFIFVFINPPFFGLDERAHFMRTYLISEGNLLPDHIGADHHSGAYLPKNLTELVTTSTTDLLDNNMGVHFLYRHDSNPKLYERFRKEKLSTIKVDDKTANNQLAGANAYSPVGYLHMAFTTKISRIIGLSVISTMNIARLANLIIYIVLVYWAIKILPKYEWLMVCVALLPAALFQATVISLDPVVNGFAFILTALMIKLWFYKDQQPVRPMYLMLVSFSLVMLALTKFPYALLVIPFIFIPKSRLGYMSLYWKIGWVFSALAPIIIWQIVNKSASADIVLIQSSSLVNVDNQITAVLHNPLRFSLVTARTYYDSADVMLGSMIARIGDRAVGLNNIFMYILFSFSVLLSSFYYKNKVPKIDKEDLKLFHKSLAATIVLVVCTISTVLYVSFTKVNASSIGGIQGRYFLPILPMLLILLVDYTPIKLTSSSISIERSFKITSIIFLFLAAALYLIVSF